MNTDFNYSSVASLIQAAEKNNLPVSALVLSQQAQQIELDEKTVYEKMASNFQVMKECMVVFQSVWMPVSHFIRI